MCTAANPAQVTVIWFSTDPIGPGCCCNDQIPRLSVAAGVVEALMLRLGPHAPLLCGNHSMQVEKPGNTLSHTCCLLGWCTTDNPCRISCVVRALSVWGATLATLAWQGWRSNFGDGPRGRMLQERLRSHETTLPFVPYASPPRQRTYTATSC